MNKKFLKLFYFFAVLLLYFLPSIIFPVDNAFYLSLNGPHLPSFVFIIIWSIIYILMSIFICFLIFNKDLSKINEIRRIKIFLIINYIFNSFYTLVFFTLKSLFWGYVFSISIFVTILIVCLEALLVNKKTSLLCLPYVLWSGFASVLSIIIYLLN